MHISAIILFDIIFCISAMYLTLISHIKLKSRREGNANLRYQKAIIMRLCIILQVHVVGVDLGFTVEQH